MVVPLGIFGALYVPFKLIVPGDAAITASNIMASESLFSPGFVSDLLAPLVIILVVSFYSGYSNLLTKIWFLFLGNYWPKRTY